MTQIIVVSKWGSANGLAAAVEVENLRTLELLAEAFNEPIILKKGKNEFLLVHDNVWYQCKG